MNAIRAHPEEMVARLLYRDGLMLVIDKPAGLAVHGAEGRREPGGSFRRAALRAAARAGAGAPARPRHLRLPGARPPPQGARRARAAVQAGRVGKTYWAVVEGGPAEDEGRIDLPLGRLDETRGWWMKPDPQGQPAVTTWKVWGAHTLCDAHGARSTAGRKFPLPACGEGQGGGRRETDCAIANPLPNPPPQGGGSRPAARARRA